MGNSSVIFDSNHGQQMEKTTERELENELIWGSRVQMRTMGYHLTYALRFPT